jgi:peptidoglycan/LPS O-acetylase OafA/YrhL
VDSLRAIAVFGVLFTHTGFASAAIIDPHLGKYLGRGEAGVALFFLISGFLLYRPFVSARLNGARRPRVRDYTRRRLLRIVPAYWLALTALALFPGLPGVFSSDWWVYYGFLQIYDNDWVLNGIRPAWSLCVEISFYVLLPLYAAGVALAVRRWRRWQVWLELGLLALLGVASLALRHWLHHHHPISTMLNALPAHMDWFAAGMGLAVMSAVLQGRAMLPRWARLIGDHPGVCWGVAIAAFWLVSNRVYGPVVVNVFGHVSLHYEAWQDTWRHLLYALVGAGLLLPAIVSDRAGGLVRRLLASRTLAWLGLISYGIYLWQTPLLTWLSRHGGVTWLPEGHGQPGVSLGRDASRLLSLTLLSAAVIVASAAVSYYVLERPILRFKDRRTRRQAMLAATAEV